MRSTASTNLAALNAASPTIRLLTGDTLGILQNGTGTMTVQLQYQAEALPGAPWTLVHVPNGTANVANNDANCLAVFSNLPAGYYRLNVNAWTNGSRDVQLLAF